MCCLRFLNSHNNKGRAVYDDCAYPKSDMPGAAKIWCNAVYQNESQNSILKQYRTKWPEGFVEFDEISTVVLK